MLRPNPVPPCFLVFELSACSKDLNIFSLSCLFIPIPVSSTHTKSSTLFLIIAFVFMDTLISPSLVNFSALLIRLLNIC